MNEALTKTAPEVVDAPETPTYILPRADIREKKDAFIVSLEMPGVRKEGLEIFVENSELTIIGRRTDLPVKGELLYRESRRADFRRVFELDGSIDVDRISAKMENGIVTLTLPKAEKVKPRKIEIQG